MSGKVTNVPVCSGSRRSAILQVTQTNAQVVMKRVRHADGEAEAEQSLGQTERPKVAIAAKQRAGNDAPDQRSRREHEIGEMSRGEERAGESYSCGSTRDQAKHALHEVVLQKKLLINSPEHVAEDVGEISLVEGMQRADIRCDEHAHGSQREGGGQDPE